MIFGVTNLFVFKNCQFLLQFVQCHDTILKIDIWGNNDEKNIDKNINWGWNCSSYRSSRVWLSFHNGLDVRKTVEIMKKMKISRDVRIVLFTLIFVFSIMVTFFIAKNIFVGSENKPSGQTIKHTLENISILNAAEYHYTHVEPYDSGNRKIFWNTFEVPLTNSEGVYSYQGTITAGIDFSQIEVSCDDNSNSIVIIMPEAKITGSELDHSSLRSYYEKNNLFNPMNVISFSGMIDKIKKEEEKTAQESGLLTCAENNAKKLIEAFIRSTYDIDGYEIIIKTKPAEELNEVSESINKQK